MPGMARKLRIAVSVFFGLLAVALFVLWPLTYSKPLSITFPGAIAEEHREFRIGGGQIRMDSVTRLRYQVQSWPKRTWQTSNAIKSVHFPLWFCTAISITFAAILWVPHSTFRFSLRTLLIATTLVAVVLGLGAWLAS
jgi:hypothetical protein